MAQVIVLGSGTSSGVPIVGVDYPPQYLANPKNWRTRPSILIEGPGGKVLVDCAPDLRTQLLRENIKDIAATIITHSHADHIMGMDDLRPFCIKNKTPMPIYANSETQEDIKRIFPYAFADFPPGIEVPRFDLLTPGSELNLVGLKIRVMTVMHGPMPVLALRINDFGYVTDVSEIPKEAWDQLQDLDTLILDAVRIKPHPNHFHFDRAIEVAQQLNANQTYFNHLSHDYDHDKTNSELPKGIALSYDGQRISI